jgi:predicted O-methyltransferase YrrM
LTAITIAAATVTAVCGVAACSSEARSNETRKKETRDEQTRDEEARARDAYDRYRRPELVVAALALTGGERVADIGAGTGYLTHRLAAAAGASGRVVATDVDARALEALEVKAGEPIEKRVVGADEPGLEAASYDVVLMAEVDQLLRDRVEYLQRVRIALKRGGRLTVNNKLTYRAALLEAAAKAGFAVVRERDDLPGQYVAIFEVLK